jgi:sulfoxide reductase catalytic subunit YedY
MAKKISPSEITPKHIYLSRRDFMKSAAVIGGAALLAACTSSEPDGDIKGIDVDLNTAQTDYDDVISYNNFYEFTTSKNDVVRLSKDFQTSPWEVKVEGLVNNPITLGIEDFKTSFDIEERIYRMRCVEGWSMVIPWMGFPLKKLIDIVEPKAEAKYLKFETLYDPDAFPGQQTDYFAWPYVEGLTIEEAMNDLAILSTGLYGEDLLPQNGAPIRLVVPWKYGFKSIKSIVNIDFVEEMPVSLWMAAAPNEYGFYANVNPEVDHPRWSQKTERRIGDSSRIPTQMFNGYEEEVAYLYEGLDLQKNF